MGWGKTTKLTRGELLGVGKRFDLGVGDADGELSVVVGLEAVVEDGAGDGVVRRAPQEPEGNVLALVAHLPCNTSCHGAQKET